MSATGPGRNVNWRNNRQVQDLGTFLGTLSWPLFRMGTLFSRYLLDGSRFGYGGRGRNRTYNLSIKRNKIVPAKLLIYSDVTDHLHGTCPLSCPRFARLIPTTTKDRIESCHLKKSATSGITSSNLKAESIGSRRRPAISAPRNESKKRIAA